MLLNHRSGLPNYVHYLDKYKWDKRQFITNEGVLQSLYTYKPPLQFNVGRRFSYCNTNYALLALVIEKVSGLPYGQYLDSIFFKPLQMNDTYVFSMADTGKGNAFVRIQWSQVSIGIPGPGIWRQEYLQHCARFIEMGPGLISIHWFFQSRYT